MNPEPSSPESLTRRQFIVRTAIVGGALATPVNLFGQTQPAVPVEAVAVTDLRQGWNLKSVDSGAELTADMLARANAFADIERRLAFPDAKLDVEVADGALTITTDKFARAVNLTGDADGDPFGWFFEDNYFDLLPGEKKVVRILGDHQSGRITAKPWYSPHSSTVDWRLLPVAGSQGPIQHHR